MLHIINLLLLFVLGLVFYAWGLSIYNRLKYLDLDISRLISGGEDMMVAGRHFPASRPLQHGGQRLGVGGGVKI